MPISRPASAVPVTPPGPAAPAVMDADDDEPFDAVAFFNPYSGPPDGDDAWLADVAAEIAGEYLDAQETGTPASAPREVLAAGFTHRDAEPGARGFAAGGPLDQMAPGPVLAGFADDAVEDGLAGLTDDELIGVLCAARRLSSWTASVELRAVNQLDSRRAAYTAATGDSRQAEHVGDEVAAALTLTCRAADRLVSLAAGITRLPAAAAALAAGRIDLPRAIVFTEELANLGDVAAAAVAALAAPDAPGLTTGQLREVLHRAVLALDPDAARKRREKAQKSARVECWTEPSGTWSLAGRDLPPIETLAADKLIDAAARNLKAAGAEGTLEQLRAKVFIARLTCRPLYTLLPGQDDALACPDGGNGGDDQDHDGDRPGPDRDGNGGRAGREDDPGADDGRGTGEDGPGEDGPGGGGSRRLGPGPFGGGPGPAGSRGGGLAFPPVLSGSVNLIVPLATWLGLTGQPGEAAGHGPLDAATSRDLAAFLAAQQGNHWCLTIVTPDGRAVGHGCARTGPAPGTLGGPAPPGGTGPPGQRAGPGGAGPPGQRAGPGGAGPPGQRAGPGGAGPPGNRGSTGSPGTSSPGSLPWLTGIKIKWLEVGDCTHQRETLAYRPSNLVRHLVKTRDRTCSFPGCRRSARRCDDDHTVPFDQGGRSCECNLAPLCRRHHAAKQAPGWHLEQPRPGILIWRLPSGRTQIVTPRTYLA